MRYRILGPLEVRPGPDWQPVRAGKNRALLAALLLHCGQIVSADRLIAEMWGDDPPESAAKAISVHVFRLRQLLADPDGAQLTTRAPGYLLRCGPGELDARVFEARAADGRRLLAAGRAAEAAGELARALSLWRGPALADVPRTARIGTEADRLEEARLAALELRIEAGLRCGRHGELVPELRKLTAEYPLREGVWVLLLRALAAAGRHAEAVAAYGQARAAIADELGTEPGPALRELFQLLLTGGGAVFPAPAAAGEPAGGPPDPPAQLPADMPDFTGRSGPLDRLRRLLRPQQDQAPAALPVVVVSGAPGLGKTALAVHAAHALRAGFPDGQLYVSLRGGGERPVAADDVLARFLRGLGVPPARIPLAEEERAALYRTVTARRRLLVVLDDAADAAQVRPLLPGSASCAVLITSRNRLASLAGSQLVDLDVLGGGEAASLFARIVGAGRVAAEPAASREVLAACAGLPLAIRIAAARLAARPGWQIRTLAGRLADTRRRIDEFTAGDLAVRACFEVSFAALRKIRPRRGGVDPARAFAMLGLWQGPSLSLAAAAVLIGEEAPEVAGALDELVDAHLIESPAPDRYAFHDLLRAYAAQQAAGEPQQVVAQAKARLLTWYLRTSDAAAAVVSPARDRIPPAPPVPGSDPLAFGSPEQALSWCAAERANLVAATTEAAALGRHDIAWKLPVSAMVGFDRNGYRAEWAATHKIALASARQLGDRRGEAWVLNNLGMVASQQRAAEALDLLGQALEICREIGDGRGQARAVNNLAYNYRFLGQPAEAAAALLDALAIQRRVGDSYGEAIALCNLGEAYLELGQIGQAVARSRAAAGVAQELGSVRIESYAQYNLGWAELASGRPGPAAGLLEQALAGHQATGDKIGEAQDLHRLGDAYQQQGRSGEAAASWRRACALFTELAEDAQAAQLRDRLGRLGLPGPG